MLGDGGAFGQVLADQPTCVLVGSWLPWAVGIGEIHRHIGGPATGRRSRCIWLPWSGVRVPFINQRLHTPVESFSLEQCQDAQESGGGPPPG